MNPWRAPQKILARHAVDELANLAGNSGPFHRANDHVSDIAKALTSPLGANARPSPAGRSPGFRPTRPSPRQQKPKQPIAKTETRTTRAAPPEHRDLVTQRDHFQH